MLIINSSLLSVADSLQKNVLLYRAIKPLWSNVLVVFLFRTLYFCLYKTLTTSVTLMKDKTGKEFFL